MTPDTVAILGFVVLFVLMLLRVPVGMAMGLVGVCGFGVLNGWTPALKLIGQSSMRTVTDYQFGVIPMFLLMGAFVTASGMSRELFRAANALMGHFRGGLGFATILACGGVAAISGSSVATAATFSTVAYPEMRRHKYPQSFATGVIAAGGTLGAMFPPSTVLAVYGVITEQDIGKLFIAGIVPGLLAVSMYLITIMLIGFFRPDFLPTGERASWQARLSALSEVWAPMLLFVFVIPSLVLGSEFNLQCLAAWYRRILGPYVEEGVPSQQEVNQSMIGVLTGLILQSTCASSGTCQSLYSMFAVR